jgi:hypothetical protein
MEFKIDDTVFNTDDYNIDDLIYQVADLLEALIDYNKEQNPNTDDDSSYDDSIDGDLSDDDSEELSDDDSIDLLEVPASKRIKTNDNFEDYQ